MKSETRLPGLPYAEPPSLDAGIGFAPLDFSPPVPIDAAPGETIRAIAERQRFSLPYICFLNGRVLMRAAWDAVLTATDSLCFIVLPARGGSKDIFRFVLQIGITIMSAYLLGPAGLGLTGTALQVGVAVASLAGAYLVNVLLPVAPASMGGFNSGEQGSPTYSLSAQGSQARLGGPIPRLYGRHMLTPDFAAQPYTEFAGNELYLYQLFSLGLGLSDVESIRIAKTEAWHRDTGYSDAFSDITFEIVPPGGLVTLFPANVVTSQEVSGQTLDGPNKGGDWMGGFVATPAGKACTRLAFDYAWRGGAGHLNDDGSIGGQAINIRQEARKIDDAGAPIGGWFLLAESPFQFATRTAQRVSLSFDVPEGRYEARAKRVNNSATDTRDWDEVAWEGLRAYLPGANSFPCQVLAMKARATNQLSAQASRLITVIQTSLLPTWTGDAWSGPLPTRDIFPIVADILRNTDYGAGRPDDRIDIDTLVSLHATWTARGETWDGVFDGNQSVWDVMSAVLYVGRTRPVEIGDTVTFVRDEKQTVPKMLLTPREITSGGFRIDYDLFNPSTPDDVLIEFVDERTWDFSATVRATLPGSASKNPVRLPVKGIVDRARAWRFGMYMAAHYKYRREYVTAPTEYDGRILTPMSLVQVSHPLCDWGRSADILDYDAATRGVRLSQKAALATDADNYMRLRMRDGRPWGPVRVTAGASAYSVIIDAASLAGVEAAQGPLLDFLVTPDIAMELDEEHELTAAVLGSGTAFERDTKVFGITYQGDKNIVLSLVADDDRVYSADEGEPPAESAPPLLPVTPAGPILDALTVVVRGTRFQPELGVSVRPAPGADIYLFQLSYDHISWTLLRADTGTTWEGPVEAATVWIRATAVGTVRGPAKEWFADLTATDAPPAAIAGISYDAFAQHAWLKFAAPTEDGVKGIIAKTSTVPGFNAEASGTVQYDGDVTSRILLDLGTTGEIYARVAAYNVFGQTGLNWSSELHITARRIAAGDLSPAVKDAFNNAAVLPGGVVYRVDGDGNIAGFAVISGGELHEVAAAFLVNTFTIALPGGTTAPLFIADGDGIRISDLFVKSLTADALKAVWAEVDVLRGGRLLPPTGTAMEINFNDGFIRIDKVV